MLSHLRVHNLAVIEDLDLRLGAGLTVVTGETGSGKSMVMRALRLAAARESDHKWVGPADDHTFVEIEIDDEKGPADESPLYDADAGAWSVTCRLTDKTRRYSTWDATVTRAETVRETLGPLIRFVRQGEASALKSLRAQREWLDGWAGHGELVADVAQAWGELRSAREGLDAVAERVKRSDYERFEHNDHVKRLTALDISDDAYAQVIEHERMALTYAGLGEHLTALMAALDEDEGPWGRIMECSRAAERLPDEASAAWEAFVEAQSNLVSQLDTLAHDMPELDVDQVLDVAGQYRRLLARYGDLAAAQAQLETSQQALEELEDLESITQRAQDEVDRAQAFYNDVAGKLTKARAKAAKALAGTHLPEIFTSLALRSDVECTIEPADPGPAGRDAVSIRVLMGKQWLTLGDVSGGELSRVALALERLNPTADVIVMDEIDTGVGGQTAHLIAEQLRILAESRQVIVVTHLAQIAKIADAHLLVEGDGHKATARLLKKAERNAEIRRMKGD